jgi:hypothetical protein
VPEYDFDVATSFAGEDRATVLPVVRRLQELGVRVFYDEDHVAELWGVNLVDRLPEVYGKRVRYVLLFASKHYVAKKWTKIERQAAQERALEQAGEFLLPVRLDDTEVPGLPSAVVYLDVRRHSADEIAQALAQKLALAQHKPAFTSETPVTAEAIADLLRDKPRGWEYLLYTGVVWQGLRELDEKHREHFLRYAPRNGTVEHGNGIDLIRNRNVVLGSIIKVAINTFTAQTQEAAFGTHEVEGDPQRIIHLGRLFVETFDQILDWARDIHGTSYAWQEAEDAAFVQARFADAQLLEMHKVANDLRAATNTLVERLATGEKINTSPDGIHMTPVRIELNVPLVFEVDPELEREFRSALEKLSR